jgi:hypothetical protein
METPENVEALIKWLKSNYSVEAYDAPNHYIVIVYTVSDYHFAEKLPEEFWNVKIIYSYPEIIQFGGGSYIPRISKYNPAIEFITLKISK